MAQDWYGRSLIGAELTGTTTYQPFIPNSNILMNAIKVLVMIYNNPSFTGLTAKIYSDRGGVPLKLLHTSTNSWTKAQITAQDNGLREIYFEFSNIPLQAETRYHVVFQATGYTGTDDSHVAMMTYFPDIVYQEGLTINQVYLSTMPIHLVILGAVV